MSNLARVTRANRCPICQKDSWCLVGKEIAICMRVQGNHQHTFKGGEVGWVHRLTEPRPDWRPPPKETVQKVDSVALLAEWRRHRCDLSALASSLGVSVPALVCLGCTWAPPHKAWAFPMSNGDGQVVGIRLRSQDGRKWAVKGSHQGLFIPSGVPSSYEPLSDTVFIVEGPTDTAAGLHLGLRTIGRPSCSGGMEDLRTYFRHTKDRKVVIISDHDEVGMRGAQMLADHLTMRRAIILLPSKDLREFVNGGSTATLIKHLTNSVIWRNSL